MKFTKKKTHEEPVAEPIIAAPVAEGEPIVETTPLPKASPIVSCARCGVRRPSYVDASGVLRCTVCETARVGAR